MARKSSGSGLVGRLVARVPEGFRLRLRTFFVRLGISLAVVAILVCMAIILQKHVARFEQFQVNATSLIPQRLPAWAGESVRRDLASLPDLPGRFSIMEPGICLKVAEAFRHNPWVNEVISVRRVFPNRMSVSLRLRRPVAGVRYEGRYYLVDTDGRRLTDGASRWPRGEGAPPVIIAAPGGFPERGESWHDEAVLGAAAIAKTLGDASNHLRTRFTLIDLTNSSRCPDWHDGDAHLITDSGGFVKWGRSPLRSAPGELTPEEKVAKMLQFEEKRGPISSYRYVDIRFDNVQHGPRLETYAVMDHAN
jgi:hypothetical protein